MLAFVPSIFLTHARSGVSPMSLSSGGSGRRKRFSCELIFRRAKCCQCLPDKRSPLRAAAIPHYWSNMMNGVLGTAIKWGEVDVRRCQLRQMHAGPSNLRAARSTRPPSCARFAHLPTSCSDRRAHTSPAPSDVRFQPTTNRRKIWTSSDDKPMSRGIRAFHALVEFA